MPNKRVRDLTAASALNGTELFYADDGVDALGVKVTASQVKTYASSNTDYTFASAAALQAAAVAAAIQRIRLQTYDGTHRLGEQNRVRVTSQPAYGGLRSTDRYLPNGSTDATNGGWWGLDHVAASPQMFGAAGDGVTDDIIAFQACVNWAKTNGYTVWLPFGDYRCTDEIDCHSSSGVSWSMVGQDPYKTQIVADFTGCSKILLKFRNANRDKLRGNVTLHNFRLVCSAAVLQSATPVLLDMDGAAQLTIGVLRFSRTNNTALRFNSLNNARIADIYGFGGGRAWLKKRVGAIAGGTTNADGTKAMVVTITSGTQTINSPGSIFDANDVGERVFINDNVTGGIWVTIATQAGTSATFSEAAPTTDKSGSISFGHAKMSGTTGSNVFNAVNCAPFIADDDGCYIEIQGLGVNDVDPLYGYIEYISTSQIKLWRIAPGGTPTAVNAERNSPAGGARFGLRVVEFSSEEMRIAETLASWDLGGRDVQIGMLSVESPWGVILGVERCPQIYIDSGKLHADDPLGDTPASGKYHGQTQSHMWLSAGSQGAVLKQQLVNNQTGDGGKVVASRLGGQFVFDYGSFNMSINDVLARYAKPSTGSLQTGTLEFGHRYMGSDTGEDDLLDAVFAGDTDAIKTFGSSIEGRGGADKSWNSTSPLRIWSTATTTRLQLRHNTDTTKYWEVLIDSSGNWGWVYAGNDRLYLQSTAAGNVSLIAAGSAADVGITLVPKGSSTVGMSSKRVINVADPTGAQDAATRNFIELRNGKLAVACATTANITLSGEQTLDGILTSASRVLVKNQTAPAENGIYVSAAGAWARASDMDSWLKVSSAFVFVEQGTTLADTGWLCTSNSGGTLGTTAITWVTFSAYGSYVPLVGGVNLTGGVTCTSLDQGTKSSGTFTPAMFTGQVQHCVNGGAFTLAPPTGHGTMNLDITNNASAGAITTSGFTVVDGDPFDTTNTHAFRCYITVGNLGSHLSVKRVV